MGADGQGVSKQNSRYHHLPPPPPPPLLPAIATQRDANEEKKKKKKNKKEGKKGGSWFDASVFIVDYVPLFFSFKIEEEEASLFIVGVAGGAMVARGFRLLLLQLMCHLIAARRRFWDFQNLCRASSSVVERRCRRHFLLYQHPPRTIASQSSSASYIFPNSPFFLF